MKTKAPFQPSYLMRQRINCTRRLGVAAIVTFSFYGARLSAADQTVAGNLTVTGTLTTPVITSGPDGLALYPASGLAAPPAVFLDSNGEDSYFAKSIVLNGTNNQMPNQQSTGTASILTQQLADQRYLRQGNSIGVGSGANASNGYLAAGDNAYAGNFGLALGYNAYSNDGYGLGFAAAIGCSATAGGYMSTAVGPYTLATGDFSMCLSPGGLAEGEYSFAAGYACSAIGPQSVAMGCFSTATAIHSVAIGIGAQSKGDSSVSLGGANWAIGTASFAGGAGTRATGDYSTSFGKDAGAAGTASFAAGQSVNAWSEASFAAGNGVWAWGANSVATGAYNSALGDFSHAVGYSATAETFGQVVIGQFNVLRFTPGDNVNRHSWCYDGITDDEVFTIGNGTDQDHSSNAFVVKQSGETVISGPVKIRGTDNPILILEP